MQVEVNATEGYDEKRDDADDTHNPKYTPGPWHWNGGCNVTVGSGAFMVAATSRWQWEEEQNRPTAEQIANARLIASAPELLDSLKKLVELTRYYLPASNENYRTWETARDRIRKAGGGIV